MLLEDADVEESEVEDADTELDDSDDKELSLVLLSVLLDDTLVLD